MSPIDLQTMSLISVDWVGRRMAAALSFETHRMHPMLEADRRRKQALLEAPHVKPLVQLIRSRETSERRFPMVDPEDGGVEARVLFLQHTPSKTAVRSGFVSRENLDRTAPYANRWLSEAGFERGDYIRWNVVPYCISTEERDGKASAAEVREAAQRYTLPFLALLPKLKVIVFQGGKAQAQIKHLGALGAIQVIATYHAAARHPQEKEAARQAFRQAHALMQAASAAA
jgi:uracil-DNA glycosylase